MVTDEQVTLLIDGDTIAYRAAAAVQEIMESEDGFVMPFARVASGEAVVDNLILGLYRDLNACGVQVYLSDPAGSWRLQIAGSYKSNREEYVEDQTPKPRPLLLGRLKEYLRVKYGASHWAGLEADDVLGILATGPAEFPGKAVVVGRDKDFDTIPGLHHQLGVDVDSRGRPKVREVTQDYADWFHMVQAFAGDRVDGYPGCPNIGMERAKKILADPCELSPEAGQITRGARKGQGTTKWVSKPTDDLWRCVVSHYEKAGQTEKDALLNARLARILRHDEYDRQTGAVKLWVPPKHVTQGEKR